MSDPRRSAPSDAEVTEPDKHDPDRGSSWNTIVGTAEIEDLLTENELDDLLVEPTTVPRGVRSDKGRPGTPG